jgi:hypothetical protein
MEANPKGVDFLSLLMVNPSELGREWSQPQVPRWGVTRGYSY